VVLIWDQVPPLYSIKQIGKDAESDDARRIQVVFPKRRRGIVAADWGAAADDEGLNKIKALGSLTIGPHRIRRTPA
jgi:hypothetical protein